MLALNVVWFLLFLANQEQEAFREVAPELKFAKIQDVQIQPVGSGEFVPAEENQRVLSGSVLKTGPSSFAELRLDRNVVRFDENTEAVLLKNNFTNPGQPRLELELRSGKLWVNAFDSVLVQTRQTEAYFDRSVGAYEYTEPLSQIFSIVGDAGLRLSGEDGNLLTSFTLPPSTQVRYVDAQLIDVYNRLEYSKLKKELKLVPISDIALDDLWVEINTKTDSSLFLEEASEDYIFSLNEYLFRNQLYSLRAMASFVPEQKVAEQLKLAQGKMYYVLGGLHENGQRTQAKEILQEFEALAKELESDPQLIEFMERQFFVIRNVEKGTPAYLAKDLLRNLLFSEARPELLRTYLEDIDFALRIEDSDQAEMIAEDWLKSWNPALRSSQPSEFTAQARILQTIITSHSDIVDTGLLLVFDAAGDFRLEGADYDDEVLFEVALERLEVARALVASYRYGQAKSYLQSSYESLNLEEQETSAAAREVFLQEATLLGERIAFAERNLRGAAVPIDETQFINYLRNRERDKALEQRFFEFLESTREPDETIVYPTPTEVSEQFTAARIVVLDEDILARPDFPFEFDIVTARLVDRARDGSAITFSGTYDTVTNGIYNITLNDEPIRGSFSLTDFVRSAARGETLAKTSIPDGPSISEFLNDTTAEESERAQVVAQDLASQLAISELEQFGIGVPSLQYVQVLNTQSLDQFRFSSIVIRDELTRKEFEVSFDYNSTTKVISKVRFTDFVIDLPSTLPVEAFVDTVLGRFAEQEEAVKRFDQAIQVFTRAGIVVDPADLDFLDEQGTRMEVRAARFRDYPIEFSGTYSRETSQFETVTSSYFSGESISISDFANEATRQWLVGHFGSNGVILDPGTIASRMPAEQVAVEGHVQGTRTLNFLFDLRSNRFLDVEVTGSEESFEVLNFGEFSDLR